MCVALFSSSSVGLSTAVAQDLESGGRVEGTAHTGAAGGEAGEVALGLAGGAAMFGPYATVFVRSSLGAGIYGELRYEAPFLIAQGGTFRLGWGTEVSAELDLGFAASLSYTTLMFANGLFGIEFEAMSIGNDLTSAGEALLTWRRRDAADVTFGFSVHGTIAGLRYDAFRTREFRADPGFRGLGALIQGEWGLGEDLNLLIRLDATFPLAAEVTPIGFLPALAAGVTWSL